MESRIYNWTGLPEIWCNSFRHTTIIQNEAECRKCNDIVWSGHVHDFKSCSCGAISVDGGMDYIHRCGDPDDVIERSMSMEPTHLAEAVKAVETMRRTGRNDLGIALGVIRSLRNNSLLDLSQFTGQDS
jgi:hypothetical protein